MTTLHSLLPFCNFPCQNPISCIASFSLTVSHRRPKFTLSCSHSFFIPDSSASQYPCLRTGCSYIGAHANDLIPHTRKFHMPVPVYRLTSPGSRAVTARHRADELMSNPRLRIHPNRPHVETSLPSDQSSSSRSANQSVAIAAPYTAQLAGTQLAPQHPGLPSSEFPRWPYSGQDKGLQRSLKSRSRRFSNPIKTCYILIFLGVLTVLGSLIPALWRSIAHNDIQGGFSLAQYILGVGVFVIGCMVAIHSKTCTCWQ